jgi:alanine racemase
MVFPFRLLLWLWPVKKVSPLIEVRVSASAVRHNFLAFQKLVGNREVFPVLKANAYGHGIVEVARILEGGVHDGAEACRLTMFCVDSYFEALQLRRVGIRTAILIIGHSSVEQIVASSLSDVTFTVSDIAVLQELVRVPKLSREIAFEVDTGMHRHGVLPEELEEVAKCVSGGVSSITVTQVFSHLADADVVGSAHMLQQRKVWEGVCVRVRRLFPDVRFLHIDATAGTASSVGDTNAVRLGLGLYGIDVVAPAQRGTGLGDLRPVMEVVTKIVSLRNVKKGESVGYNATFVAECDMRVATIPMGYYEGVDRRLSNKGSVLVRGVQCAIVGRVSMNMTTVDVSDVHGVELGDEVVVMSANSAQKNSVSALAELCDTIPYELMVHVPAHLKRVIVE